MLRARDSDLEYKERIIAELEEIISKLKRRLDRKSRSKRALCDIT